MPGMSSDDDDVDVIHNKVEGAHTPNKMRDNQNVGGMDISSMGFMSTIESRLTEQNRLKQVHVKTGPK